MCYTIPGKVIGKKDNFVTLEYFNQHKRARNDFISQLEIGDYVYAQAGFVVQRLPSEEALKTLSVWKELFFKLQQTDLRQSENPKNLFEAANSLRQRNLGNSCCIHGIIEFSNYCRNDCHYCGIRKSNPKLPRYRMKAEEIIAACEYAVKELNFKALVLQSGEDPEYSKEKLTEIVKEIMARFPVILIMSIGEQDPELYQSLYAQGARGVLLRFETGNPVLYERFRPGHKLSQRLWLLQELKKMGYFIFSGFLIGLPGQTKKDILEDIRITGSLQPEMFSCGPFLPHPHTPLAEAPAPRLDAVLQAIARMRIMYPQSRILVTSALETLDKQDAARRGLLSGGNSLMINLTPRRYSTFYEIYPQRVDARMELSSRIESVLSLLYSLGRAPTDLGL